MSTVRVDALALARARAQVLPAVSQETKQSVLRSVLVEAGSTGLRLAATDRFRLAVSDVAGVGHGPHATALVGSQALETVPLGGGHVLIEVRTDSVRVVSDGVTHTLARSPGEFPAYERFLVPAGEPHELVVDRAALVAAIEEMPDDEPLRMSLRRDRLELGDIVPINIPATYDGDVVRLFVDARFLHDAAHAALGLQLAIEAASPVSPIVVRSLGDESFTVVIMPMRSGPSGPARKP